MKTRGDVLFPIQYLWFVLLATLDVSFTWLVLQGGGYEANPVADYILARWGIPGMVALKFAVVGFVVCVCEMIGRQNHRKGLRLAEWAVALNCIPVSVGLIQLVLRAQGVV